MAAARSWGNVKKAALQLTWARPERSLRENKDRELLRELLHSEPPQLIEMFSTLSDQFIPCPSFSSRKGPVPGPPVRRLPPHGSARSPARRWLKPCRGARIAAAARVPPPPLETQPASQSPGPSEDQRYATARFERSAIDQIKVKHRTWWSESLMSSVWNYV